jgi:hypothetical protein
VLGGISWGGSAQRKGHNWCMVGKRCLSNSPFFCAIVKKKTHPMASVSAVSHSRGSMSLALDCMSDVAGDKSGDEADRPKVG